MTESIRTPSEPSRDEDQRLEVAIGLLLRIGVTAAALLVIAGGLLALRHSEIHLPDYKTFHAPGVAYAAGPEGAALHSIVGVFRHLRTGSGASIIALGLLVLIATPIARVVFAIIGFARERDKLYTVISCIVLAVLLFSLMHGR